MKKAIITIISIFMALESLSSALVPFNDYYFDKDDIFSSPAMLLEEEGITHFGFEISAMSAIDYLSYLSSPAESLSGASDYLYIEMMDGDASFWNENYGSLSSMFSFDSVNIPSLKLPLDESDVAEIKAYLKESYLSRFDDSQKAYAVLKALQDTDIFSSSSAPVLNGSKDLSLKMYGGVIYSNGFGWRLKSNVGLTGSGSMLSSSSVNMLGFDMRGDVGYAFNVINEKFTIGTALEAGLYAENRILSSMLLDARFSGNLAISEPFKLGLGISVNAGFMYRHSDELAFTVDLTNLVSLRKYYDMDLTDFVSFDGIDEDPNVYYSPMDVIVRARWDRGRYHVVAELGDIVRQLIWMNDDVLYSFDFFAIPKAYFTYDLTSDLSLGGGLEYSGLIFTLDYLSLDAEISFSFKDLSIGIKAGYSF